MSSNWWASKLGGQPTTTSAPAQASPQYQMPQSQPVPTQQPPFIPSQQQSFRCPGCGSGNYGGATPEARKRCYDCGYPLQQSGSGIGTGITSGPKSSGPTQASKQVQAGGFNPQTIIGHI
jgi:hypothetical protein